MTNKSFFIAKMPSERPADYYLGYMDGCVFLDFSNKTNGSICLIRISFDGYGCCNLEENAISLNETDSRIFKDLIRENIKDQNALLRIVKQAIALNEEIIWKDAIEEYHLA